MLNIMMMMMMICRFSGNVNAERVGVPPWPQPKPTLTDFGLQPYSLR